MEGRKDLFTLGVIPARYASSRLPGKPLALIGGVPLIERVWRQAKGAKLVSDLIVATDSEEIAEVVTQFGGRAVLTDPAIPTGSERVCSAMEIYREERTGDGSAFSNWDLVINIQGDMPFMSGQVIDRAIEFAREGFERFDVTTVAVPITEQGVFNDPNSVKVVVNHLSEAIYFSRAAIPFSRDGEQFDCASGLAECQTVFGYKHFGLYLFQPQALRRFLSLPSSNLERVEKLEQLRILESGGKIGVLLVPLSALGTAVDVDTPEDLKRAVEVASLRP